MVRHTVVAFHWLLEWILSAKPTSSTPLSVSFHELYPTQARNSVNRMVLSNHRVSLDCVLISHPSSAPLGLVIWVLLIRAKPYGLGFLTYKRGFEITPPFISGVFKNLQGLNVRCG